MVEEEATEDSLTVMLLIHQLHEQRNTQNNFLIYTLISSDPSREISKMTNYDGKRKAFFKQRNYDVQRTEERH